MKIRKREATSVGLSTKSFPQRNLSRQKLSVLRKTTIRNPIKIRPEKITLSIPQSTFNSASKNIYIKRLRKAFSIQLLAPFDQGSGAHWGEENLFAEFWEENKIQNQKLRFRHFRGGKGAVKVGTSKTDGVEK